MLFSVSISENPSVLVPKLPLLGNTDVVGPVDDELAFVEVGPVVTGEALDAELLVEDDGDAVGAGALDVDVLELVVNEDVAPLGEEVLVLVDGELLLVLVDGEVVLVLVDGEEVFVLVDGELLLVLVDGEEEFVLPD